MVNRMRGAMAIALLAGMALSSCDVPRCDLSLVDRVDIDEVMENLRAITSDLGPRVAGSPQERESAEYIARVLQGYGYEVEIQEFPISGRVSPRLTVTQPTPLEVSASLGRLQGVPAAEHPLLAYEGGITGRLVEAGIGAADDFPADVAGQIAFVTRSDNAPAEVIANAAAAGAAAVLFANTEWRRWNVALSPAVVEEHFDDPSEVIPFASVNSDAAEQLRGMGQVVLNLQANYGDVSQNVIATRKLSNQQDAPIVVFSAHYDSVEQAQGASDNASGTVAIMELARLYAKVPVAVELRFAAVGAEEIGLVGSNYYVRQLPEEERARIIANYNLDMVGTASEQTPQLRAGTLDGEDNLVTISGRLAAEQLGYPEDLFFAPRRGGGSDHAPFHRAGIPAAAFAYHNPETGRLEEWYHTPRDVFERIDPERLRTAIRIVGAASGMVICEDAALRQGVPAETPGN